MLISLQDIIHHASSEMVFKRGRKYYQDGHVYDIHISKLDGEIVIMAEVEGSYTAYHTQLEIEVDGAIYFECECEAYHSYEGACKHIVALMLAYYHSDENTQEYAYPKKGYDIYTKGLVDYYEEQIIRDQDLQTEEHTKIKLYPKLIEDHLDTFLLGASVGDKKAYVLKDLYEFAENMIKGNQVSYGKNLTFIHDISLFEEQDRALVSFVMDKTVEYMEVLKQAGLYRGFNKSERKTIPLGAKAFDEFFDLVKGQEIEFVSHSPYRTIYCTQEDPKFILHFYKEGSLYKMKSSLRHYRPILCSRHKYILIENKLYRLSEAFSRDVFPLLAYMYEASDTEENMHMSFTEQLVKKFMLTGMAKVKKHVELRMDEQIKQEITPEHALIKVYLDRDEEGSIKGDVEICYNQFSFNPYQKATPEDQVKINDLVRDVQKEYQFNSILKNYDFRSYQGKIYLKEEEMIYQFLKSGIEELLEVSEVNVTDKLKAVRIMRPVIGQVGLRIESNMLHVALSEVNMPMDEVREILNAYKAKSKYYRLKDGSFVDVDTSEAKELANMVEGLGISDDALQKGEIILPKYRALYLDQILKQNTDTQIQRDKYFKQIIRDVKNIEDADYEVPTSIKANLRTYQKRGYRWLKTMAHYGFGGILADDMGLGKTLQVITLIASETECDKPSLVVCPTSLTLNWESEIKRFAPHLKVLVVTGDAESRRLLLEEAKNYSVVITSYELLKRDIECYKEICFRYCIADEAQYIKNAKTLNAKALKEITSEVNFALTGTPIENSLAELWSLFDFVMPGYLFTYHQFKAKYESSIVKFQDEIAIRRLQKMVAPFILRRLKKEVLKELPDKTETLIYNNMEAAQRKIYLAHLAKAKEALNQTVAEEGFGKSHIKILALLTRLRQLCNHPSLYLEDYNGGSGKLEQCMEIIKESIESGHRILLFSQFTSMLEIISKELGRESVEHLVLTGSTKAQDRMQLVDTFNTSDIPIFLISLKAGGTGLNLTGADVVIHYDPWWNLSSQNQATDRAYRIGQKNNVQVFQLITKDSIEEKIKELQDKKIGLTESVLQEGENLITKMTEEDIRGLFELE